MSVDQFRHEVKALIEPRGFEVLIERSTGSAHVIMLFMPKELDDAIANKEQYASIAVVVSSLELQRTLSTKALAAVKCNAAFQTWNIKIPQFAVPLVSE